MKNLIIGLVIAVIGGIVVLAVEYNYFNPKPPRLSTSDTSSPKSSAYDTSTQKPSLNNSPVTSLKQSADITTPQTGSWREKVGKMYDAAREISYDTSARNKALQDVMLEALRFKDYNFAIKIAQEISYDTSSKNNALEEIIKHACANQDCDAANKAADLITFDTNKKNENKKRILDAIKGSLKGN